ncbi:hypothetical protein, partial [Sporosarcina sp. BP05]|uniref:hypothetical protein n=1 Tax=Sporosarcina sp. BP05 TaxID=2758726 RepID=UPI00164583C4
MNGSSINDNSLLKALQEEIKQKRRIAYDQIENQFIQNKSSIDKVARSADCSLDQAFLFCLFHHTGTEKLDEGNFSSALMKYLGDQKMMEFISIQEIKSFINDNFMFFENVDYFESINEYLHHVENGWSFSDGDVSIFNNVYLFNRLTIDDFEHILNNKEPNPIHDFQVEFDDDFYRIYFLNNSKAVLRIRVKNEEQKNQIIKKVNKFDEVSKRNRLKDHYLLEIEIDNLESDIVRLFNNFIGEIPRVYFLDFQSHRVIEYIILERAYLKELLFEAHLLSTTKSMMNHLISIQPEGSIAYLIGVFESLEKIVARKTDVDINLIPAFMWMVLRKQVIKYFANEWKERFGIYFKSIDGDYIDFIKAYCEIQEINILEEENISLFTYFLMNKKVLPPVKDLNCYFGHYVFVEKEVELLNEIITQEKFENKLMQKPITKKM